MVSAVAAPKVSHAFSLNESLMHAALSLAPLFFLLGDGAHPPPSVAVFRSGSAFFERPKCMRKTLSFAAAGAEIYVQSCLLPLGAPAKAARHERFPPPLASRRPRRGECNSGALCSSMSCDAIMQSLADKNCIDYPGANARISANGDGRRMSAKTRRDFGFKF